METSEILRYCDLMEEVKRRLAAVDEMLVGAAVPPLPLQVRVESVYLQFRKVLEIIAFGSLVSNLDRFQATRVRFSKYWNAAELLRDLERLNRDFYPKPKIEEESSDPRVKRHLVEKTSGYLTKGEFLELYGRSGDILHARNPYGGSDQFDWFLKNAAPWRDKIIGLLNCHLIHLVGMSGFYLIHMNGPDGKVHHYTFMRAENGAHAS